MRRSSSCIRSREGTSSRFAAISAAAATGRDEEFDDDAACVGVPTLSCCWNDDDAMVLGVIRVYST